MRTSSFFAIAFVASSLGVAAADGRGRIGMNQDGVIEVSAPMDVQGKLTVDGLSGDVVSTLDVLEVRAQDCETENIALKSRVQELEDEVQVLAENQDLINKALEKLHLKVEFHATTKTSTTNTVTTVTTVTSTTATSTTTTKTATTVTTTTPFVPKCVQNNKLEDGNKHWKQTSGNAFNSFPWTTMFGARGPSGSKTCVRSHPETAVGVMESAPFLATSKYLCYYQTGFCQQSDLSQCTWTQLNKDSKWVKQFYPAASDGDGRNSNVGDNWERQCKDISEYEGAMVSVSLHDTDSTNSHAWGGWDDFSCCDKTNDCL